MAVPIGIVAMWSGPLAAIPPNWNLCDGSGATPDLVNKFIKGVASSTDPGSTGGNTTHNHTMTSAGAHTHTTNSNSHSHALSVSADQQHNHGLSYWRQETPRTNQFMQSTSYVTLSTHSHTTYSASHSHTTSSDGAHTHVVGASSNNPAYYEIAFIQAAEGAVVTTGIICLWHDVTSNIPVNWAACDGSGGRPSLNGKFLRGISSVGLTNTDFEDGDPPTGWTLYGSGASQSRSTTQVKTGTYSLALTRGGSDCVSYQAIASYAQFASKTVTLSAWVWCSVANSAFVFIDDGVSYQISTIHPGDSSWHRLSVSYTVDASPSFLAARLALYNIDTTAYFDYAVMTVAPGDTGGSDSHTHTLQNNATHNHTHSDSNNHRHNTYSNSWTHSHNTAGGTTPSTSVIHRQTDSGYSHSHGYTGYDGSHTHTIGSGGVHNDHTVNNASTLPPYIEAVPIYSSDTDFRIGCICIWPGTLASIPGGWALCDGSDGTPNYLEKFIRATTGNPGSTGGSLDHTHTETGDAGAHTDHSWSSVSNHSHSTSSGGAHTHSYSVPSPIVSTTECKCIYATSSAGNHNHGNSTSAGGHNHTTNSNGAHNHQPWSLQSQEPEYYAVAFIICTSEGEPFPDQYSGLRMGNDEQVVELCLVAEGDGAVDMGGIPKIYREDSVYDVYLVETDDQDASPVRIKTTTGIKAVRQKT